MARVKLAGSRFRADPWELAGEFWFAGGVGAVLSRWDFPAQVWRVFTRTQLQRPPESGLSAFS